NAARIYLDKAYKITQNSDYTIPIFLQSTEYKNFIKQLQKKQHDYSWIEDEFKWIKQGLSRVSLFNNLGMIDEKLYGLEGLNKAPAILEFNVEGAINQTDKHVSLTTDIDQDIMDDDTHKNKD